MKIPQKFYTQPTRYVAQHLLGAVLVSRWRGQTIAGIICETEAYVGPHDLASHASRGKTERTKPMFGPPGYWYIYLIYGMYHCLNIVTERNNYPAAVLIRAVVPISGINSNTKTDGPGKLCQAFHVNRALNATPSFNKNATAWIEDRGYTIVPRHIKKTPRIGVDYAGAYREKPWRFVASTDAILSAYHRANH